MQQSGSRCELAAELSPPMEEECVCPFAVVACPLRLCWCRCGWRMLVQNWKSDHRLAGARETDLAKIIAGASWTRSLVSTCRRRTFPLLVSILPICIARANAQDQRQDRRA